MAQNITYHYKKADAIATLKPNHFLFSEDTGTKGAKRFLVTTRENMYALINSKEESSYYENIEENDEVKLHFDIDIKVQNAKHNENFLKDQVDFCIEQYNKILYDTFKVIKPQTIILDASIETKLSAHIVYTDVHFRNISDLKIFVSLLDRKMRESCFIDPLIYRVGCLRMLGNTKIGRNNRLTVKRVINYTETDKKTIFLDTLVTNINKNSRLINIEPFIKTSIAAFKKTLPVKNITVPVENIINGIRNNEQYDVATLCISLLSKKRSDNYSDWIKIGICLYNIENTTRCFDLYHEFSKKSEKYTNEFECAYKWKSFMAKNNALKKITIGTLKYMAKKDNPVEYEKNILSTKVDLKPFETIKFNQEYMVDLSKKIAYQSTTITDWIEEEEIKKNIVCAKLLEWINSETIKSFAIKSTYNTGKTVLLSLLFEEYKLKFPKILLVSYRKSLTSDFIHNFSKHGFRSYESGHYEANRLICQIESLHKIDLSEELCEPIIPSYDLVVIDEIVSVLNHYMSQTIKIPESVFINLCKILQSAKKIISLDGDFENRAYDFMTHFGNVIVMENTIKKNIKHFNLISSPVTFNNKLEEDLKNGKNIFLVCLSATIATRYNNTYAKYNPILFCADMDDNIKKKLLNVEKEWIKHQLVIITPCVESGVSFNVPHFYKQYAIINDKSTSPRGLMQMLGRVRQLEVYDVDVFINNLPTANNNCFFTFNEVQDYVKYIKRPYYKDIKELTLYDTINIHNHVEKANKSRNIFIPYFLHLCDIKGHTYKLDEIKCAPETKSSVHDKKSILDKTILVTTEEAENIMANIIKSKATQLEKYSYEKYMYAIHWKLDCIGSNSLIFYGRTLDVSKTVFESDFFEKWYGKTYILYNLRNFLSGNTIKVHDDASTIINFKDIEDDTKIKLVRGLLADLGLTFGTIVDDTTMKKNIINTITNNKVFNDKEITLLFGKGRYSINNMVLNYNKKRHDGKFIQYINQHILVNYGMIINITKKTHGNGKYKIKKNSYNLMYVDNIDKYL